MRAVKITIKDDMTITEKLEQGKVKIIVLDGVQAKAKKLYAVEHGHTIIETAKGKAAKIIFDDQELF